MKNLKTCHGCGVKFKPNFRAQRYCSQPCWTASTKHRELMLERWQHPEFRTLVTETSREYWRNHPEFREYISETNREAMLKRWRDNSELKASLSALIKPVK